MENLTNGFEIKIENSPLKIENNNIKLKNSLRENSDFEISFEDYFANKELWNWLNVSSSDNVFDEVHVKVLTKPYPYKSKKKRQIKKWWDKHSKMEVFHNVQLDFSFKE